MKTPLYLDTETFCETPITNGTYRYAETAEIIMWQWAVGDGPVIVRDGDEDITDLLYLLADPQYEIVIQNSAFDRTVMCFAADIHLQTDRIFDTMVCAMAHSLPGALAVLCDILSVPTDKTKDKAGKALIQLFCKPQPKGRKLRRATKHTHPDEWQRFCEYGKLDVIAMREVYKRLPRWNFGPAERAIWQLDQKINDRGVMMDADLARAAITAAARSIKGHAEEAQRMTDGAVQSTTQRDKMLEHILEWYGILLPDLTISTIERCIADPDIPRPLAELLAVRLQASKTSTSKYKRVINGMNSDGRLRGLLAFCGATRTGRWAGRLLQPQNLPRPTMKNPDINRGIEELKANAEGLI